VLAVVAALGASVLYALASVFQQREAERQPAAMALRLSLVTKLARRPMWILGMVADAGALGLQVVALWRGLLVVVQPLLVVGLLFALPLRAHLAHRHLRPRDWLGAVLTTVGLGAFLVVSNPGPGHTNARTSMWILILATSAAATAILIVIAHDSTPRRKALAYGSAAGVVYGVTAALIKTVAHFFADSFARPFTSWQLYVLVAAGACLPGRPTGRVPADNVLGGPGGQHCHRGRGFW
jgi:drug/metabolite transporter (DMT)-like permease